MLKALKENRSLLILATGTVQGIGFRPYIFNLAKKTRLCGYIRNTGYGAEILVQGKDESIKEFVALLKKAPFKANFDFKSIDSKSYKSFKILNSKKTEISSEFPADLAMCDECRKELFNKKDRRYLYPFINCVNCGPRFSIIKKLPYDRKNTTMIKFKMCKDCQAEYDNPSNRRFHAQPNACPKCGPSLFLYNKDQKILAEKKEALNKAILLLKQGKILALKSIGGYHLVCDASNLDAVYLLRKRKQRPAKPFAIMGKINTIRKFCFINEKEKEALLSKRSPIVLLDKKNIKKEEKFFNMIAPDNSTIGCMLPNAPIHHILINEIPLLVMTSGNISDEPISINEKEVFNNLKNIADHFLVNDREIVNRSDDSIEHFFDEGRKKILIRRSRGYVPEPIEIETEDSIFAAGGDMKNNFCIVRKGNAYMSQYIGDLQESANIDFFKESIKKMEKFLDIYPKTAVCDAHPGYFSSEFTDKNFTDNFKVYHHYAHIGSVIAEHKLKGKVLGFSFDGTGYGEDGKIWGGEIVSYNKKKFKRLAHFDYFKLPGGDICTKEIWRIGLSLLHKYDLLYLMPEQFKQFDYKPVLAMLDNNINSPETSSLGRLFDAFASLIGIKYENTFEAEAAIAMESLISKDNKIKDFYTFKISKDKINIEKMIYELMIDIKKNLPKKIISIKIHNTICEIMLKYVLKYCENEKVSIALSGGVFQNIYILENISKRLLKKCGLKVFFNEKVPINDGGIALGQAYIGALFIKYNKF